MNKKLLIGGAVVVSGLAIWFYLKSKSNKKLPTPSTPPAPPAQSQNSAERKKIYDDVYLSLMSYDKTTWSKSCQPSECVNDKCPNGKPCKVPMSPSEIANQNRKLYQMYSLCILDAMDTMNMDDLLAFKQYIDISSKGGDRAINEFLLDPLNYRKYMQLSEKYPSVYSDNACQKLKDWEANNGGGVIKVAQLQSNFSGNQLGLMF
jgi:hypothetical protein